MTLPFRQTFALVALAVVLVAAPLGAAFLCATCADTFCPDSAQTTEVMRVVPTGLVGVAAALAALAPLALHIRPLRAVAAPFATRLSCEHAVPLRI